MASPWVAVMEPLDASLAREAGLKEEALEPLDAQSAREAEPWACPLWSACEAPAVLEVWAGQAWAKWAGAAALAGQAGAEWERAT